MTSNEMNWTDEDEAHFRSEALPDAHPALFVDVFRTGLTFDQPDGNVLLEGAFVTPESRDSWGNFDRVRELFNSGLKISATALYGIGAPDVAYVRLVETDEYLNENMDDVPASAHVTLIWRPEIAVVPNTSWRIHAIGEAIEPRLLPRSSPDIDPRETY